LARRDRLTEERDIAIVGVNLIAQPAVDHNAVLPTAVDMVDQPHRRAGFQISVHAQDVAQRTGVRNGSGADGRLRAEADIAD